MIGAGTDAYTSYSQRGGLHIVDAHAGGDLRTVPDVPPAAHAAQLGRHRRRHARPLADHRQDAGAGPVSSIAAGAPAASRRRRAPAMSSPHTIATRRAAPDRRAVHARPLPHRPPDRRSGRRRGRALRDRHAADPLPLLRRRARKSNSATAARRISRGPPIPSALDDAAGPSICICAAIPKGAARRALAPHRMAAAASSTACATPSATGSSRPTRRASAPDRDGGARHERSRSALAAGGRIDRASRCASPSTAGAMRAIAGDTLASALLANGVHLVGRTFKYHRPARHPRRPARRSRTRWSRSIAAPAAATPNLRATQVELYRRPDAPRARTAGRRSASISAPSTTCCRRCLPAGFYYKTFMWPPSLLARALRAAIRARRRARHGADAARSRPLSRSATPIATCWSSAPARPGSRRRWPPRESGARVILCDEQAELGGSLLAETRAVIDG